LKTRRGKNEGNIRNKESDASERKRDDQVKVYTAICNVTEAGDISVTMGIVPIWLYHMISYAFKLSFTMPVVELSLEKVRFRKLGVEGIEIKPKPSAHHCTWHPTNRY